MTIGRTWILQYVLRYVVRIPLTILVLSVAVVLPGARAYGDTIDPSHMKLTFDESFKKLDASAYGPGTRWIAHTPWNGDFGLAIFDNPVYQGPFTITKDGLAITARQDERDRWHSGLLCSRDKITADATGFAQQYGYFEMSAKLPNGPGVWPAFWLIGTDRTSGTAEIDILEYYGVSDRIFHSTEHFWGKFNNSFGKGHETFVTPGLLSNQFNTYGVLITPSVTTFYFNRQEIWSTPTPPEYRQPMYILVDLALGGGWPIKHLQSPQVMNVQYIRVYQAE